MVLVKLVAFADNDVTKGAKAVNQAIIKEQADVYCFVGDGPYSKDGVEWTEMMGESFNDKKDKLMMSRGNHDTKESEDWKTQEDIAAWYGNGLSPRGNWLMSRQVGNIYIISMDTEDLDREFRDRDQYIFVTTELAKAKQLRSAGQIDWIVMLAHKPFFTLKSSHSPYTAVRFMYKDIFRDAQVDFCVSGHNHNTQLWKPMVPNQSQANGEGQQLFTMMTDNKTFDFAQDHGAAFIVTGHAGHEWNAINDSGAGITNVQHYRDDGKFGYTVIETNGKKAKVLSKDTDNATTFEYDVSREGTTTEPESCPDGQCKDASTGQCRPIGPNEIKDAFGMCKPKPVIVCPLGQHWSEVEQKCVPNTTPDPVVCPRDYHFDTSLQKCIPNLEPKISPVCPDDYKWDSTKGACVFIAPEPGEPFAKLTAPNQVEANSTVVLDGSQSVGDSITITQTSGQSVSLTDVGQNNKKQFTAPDGNFTLGFELKAVKGTKQASTQISIIITKTPTTPTCPPGQKWDGTQCVPITTGEEENIDANGISWTATGQITLVRQSRDEDTDDRWSENVEGLEKGFEAVMISK